MEVELKQLLNQEEGDVLRPPQRQILTALEEVCGRAIRAGRAQGSMLLDALSETIGSVASEQDNVKCSGDYWMGDSIRHDLFVRYQFRGIRRALKTFDESLVVNVLYKENYTNIAGVKIHIDANDRARLGLRVEQQGWLSSVYNAAAFIAEGSVAGASWVLDKLASDEVSSHDKNR